MGKSRIIMFKPYDRVITIQYCNIPFSNGEGYFTVNRGNAGTVVNMVNSDDMIIRWDDKFHDNRERWYFEHTSVPVTHKCNCFRLYSDALHKEIHAQEEIRTKPTRWDNLE